MNPLEPLNALLAQTERERDAVQAEVARANAAHAAAEQQLRQLADYRRSYEARWGEQFRQQASMDVLHCYQGFNVRLHQALEQQQRAVELAAHRLERERVRLAEHEVRVASVGRLIERRLQEAQLRADRREQKESDAFAARAGWAAAAARLAAARRDALAA